VLDVEPDVELAEGGAAGQRLAEPGPGVVLRVEREVVWEGWPGARLKLGRVVELWQDERDADAELDGAEGCGWVEGDEVLCCYRVCEDEGEG
jgi:hypothetical protein